MIYYFSSPIPHVLACKVENVLMSFANDSKRIAEYAHLNVMIDSGAFTVWNSSKGEDHIDIDDYIKFLNTLPEKWVCINLDVIPTTGGGAAHIEECCHKSIENYLYLKDRVKQQVLPVYHYGDPEVFLDKYLDHTDYIGISPANDTHEKIKRAFLRDVYKRIGYKVKTHLLGYSSTTGLFLFPAYSFDSISWKRIKVKDRGLWGSASKLHYFQRLKIYEFQRLEKSLKEVWERRGVRLWD